MVVMGRQGRCLIKKTDEREKEERLPWLENQNKC